MRLFRILLFLEDIFFVYRKEKDKYHDISATVALQGATNITIPIIQHNIGGISALTLFAQKILSFLAS